MRIHKFIPAFLIIFSGLQPVNAQPTSSNPVFPGWYADPEGIIFNSTYWIYPTYSAPYDQQVFMDAFSSRDLVHWTKHSRVLDTANVKWVKRALWAPSIIQKDNRFLDRKSVV